MRFSVLLLAAFLGGCVTDGRAPVLGPAPLPANYPETTGSVSQPSDASWWTAFRDPVLDRAIADGLAGNLDIQIALLRINDAKSSMWVAGSAGLPQINYEAGYTRTKEEGEMRETDGWVDKSLRSVSVKWLIDIFGEVRSQVKSAKAMRGAAVEGAAIARLALLSDISAAYIDARYYQELRAIAARTVASRTRTLDLTRELQLSGVASMLDVDKAQEAVNAAQAEQPAYDTNFLRAAHRMSTLMGQPADQMVPILSAGQGQPLPFFMPDAGVPADLVRNRPDIRKAELEFEAAAGDIGYARSQLFPSVSLSGSITPGYVRTDAKSGNLDTWTFGPIAVRVPIFTGGRLRANVQIAKSRAQQKELAWRSAVLKAVEDVENALVAFNREQATLKASMSRVEAVSKVAQLSRETYQEGMNSLLETLDAERESFDAQTRLATSRRELAMDFITLNIAVGRGLPGPAQTSAGDLQTSLK